MSILYLLDTNILLALLRDNRMGHLLRRSYSLFMMEPRPIYSIVTEAELRSIAARRKWQADALNSVEFYLNYFERVTIDNHKIIQAYVDIDVYSVDNGRSMGKNDLWIAATANVLDAHLLTTDKDFDHLDSLFLTHTYIDPDAA